MKHHSHDASLSNISDYIISDLPTFNFADDEDNISLINSDDELVPLLESDEDKSSSIMSDKYDTSENTDFDLSFSDISDNDERTSWIDFIKYLIDLHNEYSDNCSKKLSLTDLNKLNIILQDVIKRYHLLMFINLILLAFPYLLNLNSQEILERLPIISTNELEGGVHCFLCLMRTDALIIKPTCKHYCHQNCMKEWLKINDYCLICKQNL